LTKVTWKISIVLKEMDQIPFSVSPREEKHKEQLKHS
jgi:hypothetical protein